MVKPGTWRPGQSGNMHGRPLCPLKEAIRKALAEKATIKIDGKTRKMSKQDIIATVMIQAAMGGNVRAAELIYDRGFGKATQPMEIEHSGSVETVANMTPKERKALIASLIAKRNAH